MACTLNREAYRKLINEDFAWLMEQPRSLERDHIVECLEWLKENRPLGLDTTVTVGESL